MKDLSLSIKNNLMTCLSSAWDLMTNKILNFKCFIIFLFPVHDNICNRWIVGIFMADNDTDVVHF